MFPSNHHCITMAAFLFWMVIMLPTVLGEQKFLKQPQDQFTIQGSTVILECSIDNLQGPVQWTRNKFGLGMERELHGFPRYTLVGVESMDPPGNGTYNLMISNVQLEDDASYECQVMSTEHSTGMRSRPATVTVQLPPDQPTVLDGPRVSVVAGTPTNLTCSALNGRPAPNVTWVSQGNEITSAVVTTSTVQSDGKREDATSLLEITPQKSDQDRTIECRAINQALRYPLVERVQLEVQYTPEVTMDVSPERRVKEAGEVKFSCSAKSNPPEITWKWFEGEVEVSGQTEAEYKLVAISRDYHAKSISCEATNTIGATKSTHTLNVEYGPRFKGVAEHQAVDVGGDAVLKCEVDANPVPAVYWTRKDQTRILSSMNSFKIRDVKDADFGIYTCTASASGFPEINREVHLLKKDKPRITSSAEQSARFGDIGIIECVMVSVPKPTAVVWSKDGKVLDLTTMKRYVMRSEDLPDGQRSVIEVTSVQDDDYGVYNCSVENGYGKAHMEIHFSQKEVVPMAYILAGVLVGVVIIIVVGVGLFIYLRRRALGSESGSESSEDSLQKKSDGEDGKDVKIDPKFDVYGNPIDAWRTENYYNHNAEYDELSYPHKERMNRSYDYADGYGNNAGYDPYRRAPGDYGTYPGRAGGFDRYNENPYGPVTPPSNYAASVHGSEYGTYGRHSDFPPPPPSSIGGGVYPGTYDNHRQDFPPPPASMNSRLSTNV